MTIEEWIAEAKTWIANATNFVAYQQNKPPLSVTMPKTKLDITPDPLAPLIKGLMYAESRSITHPFGGDPNLIGDKSIPESQGGPAYGCLQIRSGVRQQLNALWKTSYKGTDLLGPTGAEISKKMCRDYFTKIVPTYKAYSKPLFKVPDNEFFAKSWNGGVAWQTHYGKPGYEKLTKTLDAYWQTVKNHMV